MEAANGCDGIIQCRSCKTMVKDESLFEKVKPIQNIFEGKISRIQRVGRFLTAGTAPSFEQPRMNIHHVNMTISSSMRPLKPRLKKLLFNIAIAI